MICVGHVTFAKRREERVGLYVWSVFPLDLSNPFRERERKCIGTHTQTSNFRYFCDSEERKNWQRRKLYIKKSRIYVLRIYIRCTIIDRDSCPLHLVQRSQLYLERSKNPFNGYEGCRGSSKVAGFFFGSGARSRSYITATMNWVPLYCSIDWNIVYPPEIIGSRLP